jgi:hypothetical protein
MSRIRDGLTELDPAFADAGWHASPGPVHRLTPTTATGTLTVSRTGWPQRQSPEVSEFLSASPGPRPLTLLGPGGELALVEQDGQWFACRSPS